MPADLGPPSHLYCRKWSCLGGLITCDGIMDISGEAPVRATRMVERSSTRAVSASVIQDKQRSAHPWSRLSLWFAVGDFFLHNCKYSTLFCLSCLWQMQWYFPSKQVFLYPSHHAGSEPRDTLLCRGGCASGQEEGEML